MTSETGASAVFTIRDMTCGHCEKALRQAFAQAMPGAAVQIDLPGHRLSVAGDEDRAREVIRAAGYTPD